MSTCPRCGQAVGDEVVCSNCGQFLGAARAESEDAAGELIDDLGFSTGRDVFVANATTWRVATFAGVAIVLIAVTAVFLLNMGGGHRSPTAVQSLSQSTTVPVGPPITTPSTSTTTSVPSRHSSPRRSSSSSSKPPSSTSSSTTHTTPPPTSSPPRSTSPPPPTPAVELSEGSPAPKHRCGHAPCFWLIVGLTGFSSGSHQVACWSSRDQAMPFRTYSTVATTSANCAYGGQGDRVWVVVDSKYQSNVVIWT